MTQLTHTDTGNCLVICQHCGKVTQVQCKDAAQAREDENKRILDAIEKFKTEAWARGDPCDGGFTKFYQSLRTGGEPR